MKKRYYSETFDESFTQDKIDSAIINVGVNVPSREKDIWKDICILDEMEIGETREIMGDTYTRIR